MFKRKYHIIDAYQRARRICPGKSSGGSTTYSTLTFTFYCRLCTVNLYKNLLASRLYEDTYAIYITKSNSYHLKMLDTDEGDDQASVIP